MEDRGLLKETEDDEEADEIEEIIVTGSRIARADIDGANPIIEITAEDIRATGEMSLAEVLRQSNVNSFGSFQPRSGSTAQSQATISLRGAGSGRTLVLMDGKRMAGSPSFGGVAANINSIPFSAVERVEILTDGGSALYGSDALAGVVNVIMKKDFEGAEAFVFKGDPKREGGEQEAYGFTAGLSSDLGNVVISFEHDEREIVYMADRWWSQRNFVDGKDASNATSYFDTLNASFYSCNMWSYASPGFGYEAIPACVGQGDFLGGGNVYDYGGGGVVLYPYNQIMAEDASSGRDTLFVNYNYDINDNHQINARGMVTKVNGFGRYAPVAGWFGVKCSKWGGCPYTAAALHPAPA
jgi:iron complex outermembrane receptor protein